jgi:hypothetical protein
MVGMVKTPIIRNKILRHGPDDDDKPLRPHADINEHRDEEQPGQVGSHLLDEKEERDPGVQAAMTQNMNP